MGNPVIREGLEAAKDVEEGIQDFFDTVNGVLEWVPDALSHLIDPIIEGMNAVAAKVDEWWTEIGDFLDNTGSPDKLEEHAEKWKEEIAKLCGDIAGDVDMSKLSTNTEWTGSGAEAYKAVVPPQGAALNGMKGAANTIAATLKDLANGIENFWIAFGIAAASLLVAIAAAIVEACTVVAIPATIPTLLTGLGIAIAAIAFGVTELKGIHDTIDTKQDAIETEIDNVGEEWAKATPENAGKIADTGQWEPL